MAEWEELQALVITWRGQTAILSEIVRAARLECRVIICCNDQNTINSAKTTLQNNNVDLSSGVDFVLIPNNSIWVRDYGPNCVYANGVDSLYFIDWIYNRPTRPLDNNLPVLLGNWMQIPVYATTAAPHQMVHTGGNFMSDGMGTGFSSELILEENQPGNPYGIPALSEMQLDELMRNFMGIDRYIKMSTLPFDLIHHLDMHMKLLDEETLLVGEYPEGTADGPQIEANIQYVLSQFKSPFGTPYKVVRIPMPPHNNLYPDNGGNYRTYANAVFVNKTVLVPFYQPTYDTTAQRIWETALPGHKILGIDCNSIIPSLGAIHCITKEIGVADPLRIVHQPLSCQDNAGIEGYPIYATLQHRDGIEWGKIWYATQPDGPFQSIAMQALLSNDTVDVWMGVLPTQSSGTDVYYYLSAGAKNGKVVDRPLTGKSGAWKFCTFSSVGTLAAAEVAVEPVFPNPASAITCVPVTTNQATDLQISLLDALGRTCLDIFQGRTTAGTSRYFFDATALTAGTYFIRVSGISGSQLHKLLVR